MNLDLAKALDRRMGSFLGRLLGLADRGRELLGTPAGPQTVRRILVTKFWGLGNWALLRPVLVDVRARWPGARIVVATLQANGPLVEDLAETLLLVRPGSFRTAQADLVRAVRHLRGDSPELALDFEQFARSGALLARLGGVRQRIGFATGERGRDDLYTVRVPFRRDVHVARSFRNLAEAAGVAPAPYVPGALEVPAAGRASLAALGFGDEPRVVLHPGSGDNFPGRRWSPSGFAAVGRAARDLGVRVVVTGSSAEAPLAREVSDAVGRGAVSTAGRLDLCGLVALIAGARLLVSNDTGPVHLASALSVPTFAFYGPNTPVLYGPLAPGSRAFSLDLPCSPCLTEANYRSSRCRIHVCMSGIATGRVVAAVRAALSRVVA